MISQLSQIAKIDLLLAKLSTKRFNAVLPVNIDVIKKSDPQKYLLQIGNKEVNTKSSLELEVGKKYWGVMKEQTQTHTVSLSKLLLKPNFLQHTKRSLLPEFTPQKMVGLLAKESPKTELKTQLLEHLSTATSKQDFMTITNMIAALNSDVFSMLLKHNDKSTMFQFKKRKSQSKTSSEDGMIDFYAAFEHLGPVDGVVEVKGDIKRVVLYLYYEQSLEFLQNELSQLDFQGQLYPKKGKIAPLYEPVSSLLDIKG